MTLNNETFDENKLTWDQESFKFIDQVTRKWAVMSQFENDLKEYHERQVESA